MTGLSRIQSVRLSRRTLIREQEAGSFNVFTCEPTAPTLDSNKAIIYPITTLLFPTTCKMKVKIKNWHAVATWRWDMPEDEVCGICRVQFDGTCPTCKYPGDDCPLCRFSATGLQDMLTILVIGKCAHSFHMVRY
jgi:Anaphase-promoting complex subunit 11 RING-H2 finger